MGYFDALASSSFKTDDNGRIIFFPWGVLGRGYELPSEAKAERLRRVFVRMYMAVFPIIFASVLLDRLWISLMLILPFTAGYVLWVRHVTKDLRQSEARLTLREIYANQAQRHSTWLLWLLLVSSLLFVAAGGLILLVTPSQWLFGLAGIALFGGCAFFFGSMLTAKKKQSAE